MTRITLVAFVLLTGFFYMTGKPVDQTSPLINTFADLARHKTVAGQGSSSFMPGQLNNRQRSQALRNITVEQSTPAALNQNSRLAARDIPVRNPRRQASARQYAKSAPPTDQTAPIALKKTSLVKESSTEMFGEARNKLTGAALKPFVVSYRQRVDKAKKPVLGPRLAAVLIKRELRRVGCYTGSVTGSWDSDARAALQNYNTSARTSLSTSTPLVTTLEKLQQVTKAVCVDKPAIGKAIVAIAPAAGAVAAAKIKSTAWRTKVRVKKATYRPLPISVAARRDYNSIGRADYVERYTPPQVRRAKRRRVAKKYRKKRVRRIRVAKRKARRRTAVRSWRRTYRRRRFGFRRTDGGFSLGN